MENLLEQKKAFKRRLAAWEAQQATQQAKVRNRGLVAQWCSWYCWCIMVPARS